MSEKAKGQSVPKFHFESDTEKLQKSKLRMEKSGEELERAREKLTGQNLQSHPARSNELPMLQRQRHGPLSTARYIRSRMKMLVLRAHTRQNFLAKVL